MNKRQYEKECFICKDDFDKNIYAGDTVEILTPWTFKKPWASVVYYDRLHGAMVQSKPIFLEEEGKYCHLYSFLGNSDWMGDKPYCKKIKSFLK